jgi:hypothetical protein
MSTTQTIIDADIVRIAQKYYDAIDSRDAARVADAYLEAPSTTLQFNADDPIVTVAAIREFSARFLEVVSVRHTMIDVWTTPLMGDIVPVNLPALRSSGTVTVVSTALPTFSVEQGSTVKAIPLPATSIFAIDIESQKLASVHNMFDLGKVYAALGG